MTRIFTLLLLGVVFFAAGCDTNTVDEAPELMPASVFSIDTDLFKDAGSPDKAIVTKNNFVAAALRVWPTSAIVAVNLAIPFALTGAAAQATPTLDGGTWYWITTSRVNGQNISLTLAGTPRSGGNVDWTMRITGTDPNTGAVLADWELYNGTTNRTTGAGNWSLFYDLSGTRTEVLNAGFTYIGETEKNIEFNLPTTGPPTDTISYNVEGEVTTFLWNQSSAGQTHEVSWNQTTKAGSITSSNYLGGVRSCWNGSLDDVACTN